MPHLGQPLSEAELDELNAILHTPGWPETTLGLSALDGFLTAIIISPGAVMPSRWLPWLWGTGQVETFPSNATAQRFFGLVMRHINGIAGTLAENPKNFAPIFLKENETCVVEPWCKGFMIALHHLREEWRPFFDDQEHQRVITPLLVGAHDDKPDVPEVRRQMESEGVVLSDAITESVRLLHAYWLPHRRLQREEVLQTRPRSVVVAPKVGRNEPCPCGSGRKYKKCCGNASGPHAQN